jgi:hypothetical protein
MVDIASNGPEVNTLDLGEASEAASMATATPKSWRDVLAVHPAAELLPRPSRDELLVLGEDIKASGLHYQVAIFNATAEAEGRGYSKKGDQFSLLDGISRLDAMEEVGLEFDLVLCAGRGSANWLLRTDDVLLHDGFPPVMIVCSDPYGFVLSANLRRRHLTAEQRRELVAKLIKAAPERSDRQIAEQAQSNRTTVGEIRRELEASGDVSIIDTRIDSQGREQPARKRKDDRRSEQSETQPESTGPAPTGATVALADTKIFLNPAAVIAWFNNYASRKDRLEVLGGIDVGDAREFLDAISPAFKARLRAEMPVRTLTALNKKRRKAAKEDEAIRRRTGMRVTSDEPAISAEPSPTLN